MKNILALFSLLAMLAFVACNSGEPQTEEVTVTVEDILSSATNNAVDAPENLASLFNPNSAVFRGCDFSMDKAKVSGMEQAELVKDNEDGLVYTLDINDEEFADVSYKFAEGNLNNIEVNIYSSSVESAQAVHQQLSELFNAKYVARESLWDGFENGTPYTAFLSLQEDGNNPGVTIIWEKTSI